MHTRANINQVRNIEGELVEVENDVESIAKRLHDIDPSIFLRLNKVTNAWMVMATDESGKEYIVTTTTELDYRLVDSVGQIVYKVRNGHYDFAKELDKIDRAAEKARDDERKEYSGDLAEKLAHAFRQDFGIQYDAQRSKKAWGKGGLILP